MKIIGLDFGTTNSTISYFDASGKLDSFKVNTGDTDYIPTVVTYNKDSNYKISISKSAKQNLTLKNFETYEHFKLLLGKDADKVIAGKTKTPKEVTRDFIKKLLDEYKTVKKIDKKDKLEKIVMTVPYRAQWEKAKLMAQL